MKRPDSRQKNKSEYHADEARYREYPVLVEAVDRGVADESDDGAAAYPRAEVSEYDEAYREAAAAV
jgi:hypothetical protein